MDKGTSKALGVVVSLLIGMILIFGGAAAGYRYYLNANKDKSKDFVQEDQKAQDSNGKSQENVIQPDQQEEISNNDSAVQEGTPNKDTTQDIPVEEGILRLQSAPDFSLSDLQGNSVKLSQYRGKIVFLNFWATWCPPCRAEMPHFEAANKKFERDQNAVILAVNIQEDNETVKEFIEENKYTFNIALDLTGEVANQYKIHSIPTTFIIDREGIIRNIAIGPMEEEELYNYVEELSSE